MYNFKQVEEKWQKYWDDNNTFATSNKSDKEKYYILVEFPYPSGSGLHIGHPRSYTALDSLARKRRLQGYNVLFPIGFDAFGLPAENYAIKNKIHPRDAVRENVKVFKEQLKSLGISFDWTRELSTTDPEYYKWTQWQFLKFYEHGLAYKTKKDINWCLSCKIGLSNEEIEKGNCERCGGEVVQKEKEQWMLNMKSYADKLLDGLNETNFIDRVKVAQTNWIGKSEGAVIDFKLKETSDSLSVFTTRPDTIYGATFMVIAPEHPLIEKLKDIIENYDQVVDYKKQALKKTEFERVELTKEKTGVKIKGINAVNPVNNELIQIWISDYVMMNYGTGAIMAVPAHDDRDYEFAQKFKIPIIEVIKGGNIKEQAYVGDGEMINSGMLNGITNKNEAIAKIIEYLEKENIGFKQNNYRLQDWVFSRQRFWGEPIPMIDCDDCGWVPVPEKDLPVLLPDVVEYEPTEDGESPLANFPEWYTVACPKCGKQARRETDTMPNWAGSSWYWLRYMDPQNNKEFASWDALSYWGKVDWYNGGMEHATRHLLYARFWHRFLYDIGLVPTKEPFNVRTAHGMVLGEDGDKISKSKGNGISPTDVIEEYGSDALRVYEMFMGDYESDTAWSENGLKGCKRFLERVWRIQEKLNNQNDYSEKLEVIINKTIKKVDEDIENMKYNTAISALMILLNKFEEVTTISKKDLKTFLIMLNPFAPHITEEINEKNKLGDVISNETWVSYDQNKIIDKTYTMVVQVNGKVRGKFEVPTDINDEDMKNLALNHDNVIRFVEGKEIVKIIVVPQKLVNVVVK